MRILVTWWKPSTTDRLELVDHGRGFVSAYLVQGGVLAKMRLAKPGVFPEPAHDDRDMLN
jgi:hypothetical protein